jgi:hypothetical protein
MADKQTIEYLKQAAALRAKAKKDLEDQTKELIKQKGLSEAAARIEAKKLDSYKQTVSELKEIVSQIEEAKRKQKEGIDALKSQESSLKGLSGIQATLVDQDRKRIAILAKNPKMAEATREKLDSIASLNQQLLQTSAEDVVTRDDITRQIESQLKGLKGLGSAGSELKKIEEEKYARAKGISSMTEKQQAFLNKQLAVYEGIRDTIGGVLETASLLTSTVGGVLGGAIIGAGYAMEALGKTTRDFGGYLGGASNSATILGTVFPNAAEAAKSLSAEMGGLEDVSFQTQLNTNLMATNMGISVGEAAKITSAFARVTDGSAATAQNLAASTKEFAKQNGIIPSQAMGDIAANSERFAEYSPQAAKGLAMAAVQARKLGVDMGTLGKVTDSLLDFETSITKELELSAMLGRNINLNKARGLAYEGKMGAAVKETISQLGGVDAFNKMDIFQKRQAAEALGVSVDELSKMANNMGKLNDDGTMQLSTFETWKESLTAFATGPLGSTLKGFGGLLVAGGQMTPILKDMGINLGGAVKATGQILKNFLGMVAGPVIKGIKGIGSSLAGSGVGQKLGGFKDKLMAGVGGGSPATPPPVNSNAAGGPSKMAEAFGKIKMSDVLKGAAAMVLIAGSLFILGKALQQFSSVGLKEIGMAVLGIGILTAAMFGLGMLFSGPQAALILTAAAGMFLIGAAVAALGFGINQLASGFKTFGEIAPILGGLVTMAGGIFLLSGAFTALAGSLALLGIAGIAALPALMGLSIAGAGLGMLFGVFGGGESSETSAIEEGSVSEYETQMLSKMDLLIQAVNTNRDVYMDGTKVTSVVEKFIERNTKNEFGVQGK